MAGPWEKYAQSSGAPAEAGPWASFAPKVVEQPSYDPTEGMSTTEKVLAGIGGGMVSVGRALGLGGVAEHYGLPGTKDEADALDAPLRATTAGKVGDFIGRAAVTVPVALIPGANTYAGAALIGATTGAATTEGGLGDRAMGAGGGALGGAIGKGVGDAIGAGARKVVDMLSNRGAAQQAANAGRDAATSAARAAGYKLPPSQANPTAINRTLESFAGKTSVAQGASNINQQRTNALARKALGLAEDAPLTSETLDAIRSQAGQVYGRVSSLGKIPVTNASALPKSAKVSSFTDNLTLAPRREIDAAELVRAWRQSNHDATAYYRAYGRDANPETLSKAKMASSDARKIDAFLQDYLAKIEGQGRSADQLISDLAAGRLSAQDFLSTALRKAGVDGGEKPLSQALKDARVLIAKTHNVEAALNSATGDVSATQVGRQLTKGKPLTGELKAIGQFGQSFPKAAQDTAKIGSVLGSSPLDWFGSIGLSAATQDPTLLATAVARPAVRSMLLSRPYQAVSAQAPTYGPSALTQAAPQVLETEVAKAIARLSGVEAGRRQAVGP